MAYDQFVAVGLNDRNDARLLAPSFEQLWPVDQASCFDGLLQAIDEAERLTRREQLPRPN